MNVYSLLVFLLPGFGLLGKTHARNDLLSIMRDVKFSYSLKFSFF